MSRDAFHEQLAELNRQLGHMGLLVEEAIATASDALMTRDVVKAQSVIAGDVDVNEAYARIEQICLELLGLQQPVAGDLRQIAATLKVITDLERMADHAVEIARVVVRIGEQPHVKPLVDIPVMAQIVREMVADALAAFVGNDIPKALAMVDKDHEVDRLHRDVIQHLQSLMQQECAAVEQGTQLMFVSSALERIADHATNLGEWLIYRRTGQRTDLNT
jgi:phosphate transport system protein